LMLVRVSALDRPVNFFTNLSVSET
jgi:hypothetical protein